MDKKKAIISHIFDYATAQYFSQFVGFFTAVFMRRFIGPFGIGIWNLLTVVMSYATYMHLGTTSVIFYKVPMLRGQGNLKEVDRAKNVVFSFIALITFIASVGIIGYAFFFKKNLSTEVFFGLIAAGAILICKRIYTYYVMLLRAYKDFTVLSKSVVFDAIANFSLVLLIVSRFRLYGLYVIAILMPLLNIWYIRRYVSYNLKYVFNLTNLSNYIKFGFPLFIRGILGTILNSIDRIMIVSMLGFKELGFYSIALMARSYSSGVSKNFTIVISPHFLEDFGKTGNLKEMSKYIIKPALIMSYFMAILLGMVFILGPPFVNYAIPKFTPGLSAMKVFLLTTFFTTVSPQSAQFLIVLNKQMRLIPITIAAILVNVTLNYIFIRTGWGITGVASATAISAFLSFSITLFYAMLHFANISSIFAFFLRLLLPLFYCTAALLLIDRWIRYDNLLVASILKGTIFGTLCVPLIFHINKKTQILTTVRDVLREKLKKK